ncbi:hypothetical protein [Kineococcus indalonis]|uniref:hypothetical protein n=1 Tax=Kineococcus indalonis TaxID=2696566 RepID=UPI0014133082|nr:hypothetical protein [Kineococcus indalonis]NAZ87600.1 hypothetical protein [Kineococcus indalonis]
MDPATPHAGPRTDDAPAPRPPLQALRHRWRSAVALVLAGGLAGAGVALSLPTTYTGEARVSVGSESLDARIVAGYSLASQQLASDLARYVNDEQARGALRSTLGTAAGEVTGVSASPVPESSVISVQVRATSAQAAQEAARVVSQGLVDDVNASTSRGPEALLGEYTDLATRVAAQQAAVSEAQSRLGAAAGDPEPVEADVAAARDQLAQAQAQLDVLQVQQDAVGQRYENAVTYTPAASGLRVVAPAQVVDDDGSSSLQRYGLAGAGLGLVLALVLATWRERRRAAAGPATVALPEGRDGQRVDGGARGASGQHSLPR